MRASASFSAQFREIDGDFGLCGLVETEHLGFAFEELDHAVDGFELLLAGDGKCLGPDRILEGSEFAKVGLDVLVNARSGFAAPVLADGINVSMGLGFRDPGSGCDFREAEAFKQKGRDFNSPCNDLGVFACFSVICGQMASLSVPDTDPETDFAANEPEGRAERTGNV